MEIKKLLNAKEGENVEFKEAKNRFDFDELVKYASAISNLGGGYIVFGVSDKRPRKVVGSLAFEQPERTRKGLMDRLPIKIDFEELYYNNLRVLVFIIASRPIGLPVLANGRAYWREGDQLCTMPADIMRKIHEESGHDFSADICPNITIDDLDVNAIEEFRKRWIRKNNNQRISSLPIKQLLNDCGALDEDDVTYAALVLFGKKKTLNKYLAQSEIIYEYRVTEASGPADYREDFRDAFFNIFDKLWDTINLRNTNQHYQDGFFVYDIPTFNETSIREAILNAVSHRNYQMAGSIFILQYNDRFVISNPGGFPPGITSENAINKQLPRNRRIAEILAKCGLVERSGQGMNLMFENSIKEAKALPCFDGSDDYELKLTLNGLILDKDLVIFFNKIDVDVLKKLTTQDFLILNCLSRNLIIPKELRDRQKDLVDLGILEKIGRGKYILSRHYYSVTGKSGLYTRKIGLDRDTNKELLLKHIKSQDNGTKLAELLQVLPDLSRGQVKLLLIEMKHDGIIQQKGKTSASKWYYCKSEVEK